jgi:protein SFI1
MELSFDAANPPYTPSPHRSGTPDHVSSQPRQVSPSRWSRAGGALINTSAAKLVDEENAALFRNNLLRSCWKAGMKTEQVQHILTIWERKLVEVMHRWTHPEIWIGLKHWKRRTWNLDRLQYILVRARCYHERSAWGRWRANARIASLASKAKRHRVKYHFQLWNARRQYVHLMQLILLRAHFQRLARRLASKLQRKRVLHMAGMIFLSRQQRRALNLWKSLVGKKRAIEARMASMRAKFIHAGANAAFHFWRGCDNTRAVRTKSALAHWQRRGESRAVNMFKATARMAALKRTAAVRMRSASALRGLNTWRSRSVGATALLDRAGGAVHTLIDVQGRGCNAAWCRWREAVAERQIQRRALSRGLNLRLSRGMCSFMAWATDALERRQRISAALASLSREGRAMRKALNAWREPLAERALMRQAAAAAHGPRARAFRTWAGMLRSPSSEYKSKVGRYLLLKKVSASFHLWENWSATRMLMATASGFLLNRRLLRGFVAWFESAEGRRERQLVAAAAMRKLMPEGRAMLRMLTKWVGTVESHQLWQRAGAAFFHRSATHALHSWYGWVAQTHFIAGQLLGVVKWPLARAWTKWLFTFEKLDLASVDLASIGRGRLRRAWTHWHEVYAATTHRRRSVTHFVHRRLWLGLNTWRQFQPVQQRATSVLGAMRNGRLKRGLNGWLVYVELRLVSLEGMEEAAASFRNLALSRALNSWICVLDRPVETLIERAARHFRNRGLSRALSSWIRETGRWLVMLNAVDSLCRRHLRRALNSWLHYTDMRHDNLALSGRALRRLTSPLAKAFDNWAGLLVLVGPMRVGLARLARQREVHALRQWSLHAAERRELILKESSLSWSDEFRALHNWERAATAEKVRANTPALQERIVLRQLGMAFDAWVQAPRLPPHKLVARLARPPCAWAFGVWLSQFISWAHARASLAHFARHGSARGFRTWCHYHLIQDVKADSLRRLFHRRLTRGFNGWGANADRRAATLEGMRRAAGAFALSARSTAWRSWVAAPRPSPDMRQRALAHMTRQGLSKGLVSWVSYTDWLVIKAIALTRLTRRRECTALNSWRGRLAERESWQQQVSVALARMRSPALSALRHWARQIDLATPMRTALVRLQRRGVSRAFEAWQSRLDDAEAMRRVAATHFANVGLVKGLNSLEAHCVRRQLMQRAGAAFFHRSASTALRSWKGHADSSGAHRKRAALAMRLLSPEARAKVRAVDAWRRTRTERAAMRRGAAAFSHRASFGAFQHLRVGADTSNRRRTLLMRALLHHLHAGFERWQHSLRQMPPMTQTQRGLRRQLSRAAAAFDAWYECVAGRRLSKKALAALISRQTARAVRTWASRCDEALMMAQACSAMVHSRLSRGLRTWDDWCEARADNLEQMASVVGSVRLGTRRAFNAWVDFRRTRWLETKAAGRALHSRESRGWGAWLGYLQVLERQRRALAHFTGQGLVRAWGAWEELVEVRASSRELMSKIKTRLGSRLAHAMAAWIKYLDALSFARRASAAFRNLGLKRGLSTWLSYLDAAAAQRELIRAAASRFASRQGDAWNTWHLFLQERRMRERALASSRATSVRRAVNGWISFVMDQLDTLELIASIRGTLMPGVRTALASWKGLAAATEPALRALSHARQRGLSRGWCSWCEVLVNIARKQTAMLHLLNAALARGVRSWVSFADSRHLMRLAVARLRSRKLLHAFRCWAGSAETREETGRVMKGKLSIAYGTRRQEARALNSWKGIMYAQRRAVRGLIASRHRRVRRAWARWVCILVMGANVQRKLAGVLQRTEARATRTWASFAKHTRSHSIATRCGVRSSCSHALVAWSGYSTCSAFQMGALHSWRSRAARTVFSSWSRWLKAHAKARAQIRAALVTLSDARLKHTLVQWRSCHVAVLPLRRGLALWVNRSTATGLATMRAYGRERMQARAHVNRWRNRRLVRCLNRWSSGAKTRRRRARHLHAFTNAPLRRAVNTWTAATEQHRKLRGVAGSLLEPTRRLALNRWKAGTHFQPRVQSRTPTSTLRNGMRPIKSLTWREACWWLNSIGIHVSRSPPTLLRALKEGLVYIELVRRIAPYYFMRHKVASSHERGAGSVFIMVQHFFDTEQVIAIIGCQKLDVMSLATGKAREHLDLVETFKTVYTARRDDARTAGRLA